MAKEGALPPIAIRPNRQSLSVEQRNAAGRAAGGIKAARGAAAIPAYIKAATSGPASAANRGENAFSRPKTARLRGEAAARAAKPAAKEEATRGGSQRPSESA